MSKNKDVDNEDVGKNKDNEVVGKNEDDEDEKEIQKTCLIWLKLMQILSIIDQNIHLII